MSDSCQQCHGTGRSADGICPFCTGSGKAGLFTGDWIKWLKWGAWAMAALGLLGMLPWVMK